MKWGHADLELLIAGARTGLPLARLAAAQRYPDITAAECDIALWVKIGRSIPDACDRLNRRPAKLRVVA